MDALELNVFDSTCFNRCSTSPSRMSLMMDALTLSNDRASGFTLSLILSMSLSTFFDDSNLRSCPKEGTPNFIKF